MKYRIFGPFAMRRMRDRTTHEHDPEKSKLSLDFDTKKALNPFWDDIEAQTSCKLHHGRGCYIFVTKSGRGYRPWYVGQSKKGFQGEVFRGHKQRIYNSVVDNPEHRVGKPYLFLIARLTASGQVRTSGKLHPSEANFIEQLFIIHVYRKNPELKNVMKTKIAKQMHIPGVFVPSGGVFVPPGPGIQQDESAAEMRRALGIV